MVYSTTDVSRIFGAVADPTRRAILEMLRDGERPISDLAEPFDMTLPGFCKHIRVLEGAGLVDVRRAGRVRMCTLRADTLRAGRDWISGFAGFWNAELAQIDRYLSGQDADIPPSET